MIYPSAQVKTGRDYLVHVHPCMYLYSICFFSRSLSLSSIDRYLALPLDNGVEETSLDKKTLKHIRLGELLHEHSASARLIVV